MGAWGFELEENDTYLDLLYCVKKPTIDIINGTYKGSDGSLTSLPQDYIVSGIDIFFKICEGHGKFYSSDIELLEKANDKLSLILSDPHSFDEWTDPQERRNEVNKLHQKILFKIASGSQSTSLVAKLNNKMNANNSVGEEV
jgi:hypothetical protein